VTFCFAVQIAKIYQKPEGRRVRSSWPTRFTVTFLSTA